MKWQDVVAFPVETVNTDLPSPWTVRLEQLKTAEKGYVECFRMDLFCWVNLDLRYVTSFLGHSPLSCQLKVLDWLDLLEEGPALL